MKYGFEEGSGTYVRYRDESWEPTGVWKTRMMTREQIEREYPGTDLLKNTFGKKE